MEIDIPFFLKASLNPSLVGPFCSLRHKLNNSQYNENFDFFWT